MENVVQREGEELGTLEEEGERDSWEVEEGLDVDSVMKEARQREREERQQRRKERRERAESSGSGGSHRPFDAIRIS